MTKRFTAAFTGTLMEVEGIVFTRPGVRVEQGKKYVLQINTKTGEYKLDVDQGGDNETPTHGSLGFSAGIDCGPSLQPNNTLHPDGG